MWSNILRKALFESVIKERKKKVLTEVSRNVIDKIPERLPWGLEGTLSLIDC